ncbi:enoyl-CoA hydratase/isomerase family protein [Marinobacter sp. X15-166B]|uniref:enoyl-CoA hydratase/isomerase family protein n=1 Tax=Marinobacter sp. X15-166B TaxID=1897620 RepID=UPI00085BCF2C|nr:enoyl-CoA hydratase/isomerase family protein [Marinobacter sp. X15-166B]OEY65525.1 enoyl-CoA hydratase [Marinobacter sp. X15-166B]
MTDQAVHYETDASGVARITLDRADKRNAFDASVISELTRAVTRATEDPDCRVIVLAGHGKHFSAGADLNWMKHTATLTAEENRTDARALAGMLKAIDLSPKPVIARVQGAAYGGAVGLVSACDIAVASTDARFCLSEARLGLAPAAIGPYVIRVMGARQARRYFLTCEEISADKALTLGLIHEAVAPEALDETVNALIERLLRNSPQALTACKQLIARSGHNQPDEELIQYTADLIASLRTSPEGQEGLQAFLDKRQPNWISTPIQSNTQGSDSGAKQ